MTRPILKSTALALVTTAAAALALASAASAAPPKSSQNLDNAANHLEKRYEAGRRTGSITYLEGVRVRRIMREYRALERAYKADGRLTVNERRALTRKLDEARNTVRGAAHNGYRRTSALPRVGR